MSHDCCTTTQYKLLATEAYPRDEWSCEIGIVLALFVGFIAGWWLRPRPKIPEKDKIKSEIKAAIAELRTQADTFNRPEFNLALITAENKALGVVEKNFTA